MQGGADRPEVELLIYEGSLTQSATDGIDHRSKPFIGRTHRENQVLEEASRALASFVD